MSDLISRQAAIDAVHEEFDECLVWDESGETTANEIERILDGLPSVQQEIIRCADCKYYRQNDYGDSWCARQKGFDQMPTDFCSRVERRTDEQTD